MAYDIFKKYGLDKIHDSLTESQDYKDNDASRWQLVSVKTVKDSDGFNTEYAWYTDGEKHIFMFGDTDLYGPDEDYADMVIYTDDADEAEDGDKYKEPRSWFNNYKGFDDEDNIDEEDLEFDSDYFGNANFMNDGFDRVYGAIEDEE